MVERHRQPDKDVPFLRRREEKRWAEHAATAPKPDREEDQDWLFDQAKDRLAAANEAIRSTRTFFFALLSVAAYIGVVVWGTTDEQLLRISPIRLPIINVEVPLTGFYTAVPLIFVVLHFHLLIHLGLTSRKLKRFLDDIALLDTELSDRLRNDVANFPLAQWMVRHNDAVFHAVLTAIVWILLVLIPPFLLLWMQLRFLPYQDQFFTWLQATAVAVDALLIVGFRAWFVRQIRPETAWLAGAKELRKQRGLSFNLWIRVLLVPPLFRYLFPLIPLGFAVFISVGLDNLLAAKEVESCEVKPDTGEDMTSHLRSWHCSLYGLDLPEKLLTMNSPVPTVVNALHSGDESLREKALDEILGIPLRDRHLRGADFSYSLLPKVDLRGAQLQGANLGYAELQGANLREAQLQGAYFRYAELQGADLDGAQLQGADLLFAQLQGANFKHAELRWASLASAQLQGANLNGAQLQAAFLLGAQLQGASLIDANLQGAYLITAQLEGATLWKAQLQGVNLGNAKLQGATLWKAQLQGANLDGAQLQGANLDGAQLQGADLSDAQLEGANLRFVNLQWADLTEADLSFADLGNAEDLETAELSGADYIFADGLEGTILDINQPPPDVLPRSCDGC